MQTMRYLWLAIAIVSVLSLFAQSTVQMPTMNMRSTSSMVYSGSSLPQAAATGVVLTTDQAPSQAPRNVHIRKAVVDGDDTPEKPQGPNEDPLGDVVWPLMLLAVGYVGVQVVRRRRTTKS